MLGHVTEVGVQTTLPVTHRPLSIIRQWFNVPKYVTLANNWKISPEIRLGMKHTTGHERRGHVHEDRLCSRRHLYYYPPRLGLRYCLRRGGNMVVLEMLRRMMRRRRLLMNIGRLLLLLIMRMMNMSLKSLFYIPSTKCVTACSPLMEIGGGWPLTCGVDGCCWFVANIPFANGTWTKWKFFKIFLIKSVQLVITSLPEFGEVISL